MFKKKTNNLDDIFNVCLERILIGGESIDECLADYPGYYDELKSLLTVSMQAKKAVSSIEARPEFKASLRYQINSSMNAAGAPKHSSFRWQSRLAPVALSVCIMLLISGGGTVAASGNSMPDDPLYNVKLASEQVQLFFTFDDAGKADLYSEFVGERVNEIVTMASANNIEAMNKSSQRMQSQLAMITGLSSEGDNISSFLQTDAGTQEICAVTSTVTKAGDSYNINTDTKGLTRVETDGGSLVTTTVSETIGGTVDVLSNSTTTGATVPGQSVLTPPMYVTCSSNQELIDKLYNDIMVLYTAAINNSGEVLQSLLEAISMLENSYNIAAGNIY
jgi:hypothetical protein